MTELFVSNDINLWKAAYNSYGTMVGRLSSEKKNPGLVELDEWYQQTLPANINSRHEPYLTREELIKTMHWKLSRGNFRPRLTQLVQENASEEVESTSKLAMAALPDLERAIKILTNLKAVGPATASALLCAAAPHLVPFMADESILAIPNLGKLDYTLKHYLKYAQKVKEKANQLNASSEEQWTPHKVELSLWAAHYAKKWHLPFTIGPLASDNDDYTQTPAKRTCQSS